MLDDIYEQYVMHFQLVSTISGAYCGHFNCRVYEGHSSICRLSKGTTQKEEQHSTDTGKVTMKL